jgi:holin-like protein
MLQSLAVLMVFQCLGELLVQGTRLPLPGPICGMLFLLAWLRAGRPLPAALPAVAAGLLDQLGLLFVPAGVSIIGFGALIARDGIAIMLALLLSTMATIVVTACAFGRKHAERAVRPRSVS